MVILDIIFGNEGLSKKDYIEIAIAFVGLMVSIATLWIAFIIKKRFFNQKKTEKQLDAVLELTSYLNAHLITFSFYEGINKEENIKLKCSVLQVKKAIFDTEAIYDNFKNDIIYFSSNTKSIFEVSRFLFNPLIPKSVRQQLKIYYSPLVENLTSYNAVKDNVVPDKKRIEISSNSKEEPHFILNDEYLDTYYRFSNSEASKSLEFFIECCIKLKKSIIDWFKSIGIKDVDLEY